MNNEQWYDAAQLALTDIIMHIVEYLQAKVSVMAEKIQKDQELGNVEAEAADDKNNEDAPPEDEERLPDIKEMARRGTNAVILALEKKSSIEERKLEVIKLEAQQRRLRFRKDQAR